MTISFPLSMPSTPKPARVAFRQLPTVAVTKSPYTGAQQLVEWDGALWGIDVTYPPMRRVKAAPIIAWLGSLRGPRGTFKFGPYKFGTPQGTGSMAGGGAKVKGASQVGLTLATDGWANSNAILKAGDMIQVGDAYLYMIMADATSNGSGEATLDIWPNARNHADDAAIVTNYPVGIFRLVDNEIPLWEETPDGWYSIAFSAEEAK